MLEMHDESAQNKQLLKIDIEANDMKWSYGPVILWNIITKNTPLNQGMYCYVPEVTLLQKCRAICVPNL